MKEIISKNPPDTCPYCGSGNITGEEFNFEASSRKVFCRDCDRYWFDCYNFDSILIPDEYDARRTVELGLAVYEGDLQVWYSEYVDIPFDTPSEDILDVAWKAYARIVPEPPFSIAGAFVLNEDVQDGDI